ncbi:unnamed protein product [Prorocentrum cordatum]|uniref:Uncharacterized protein n=1 Tax=Prorocentrum cordatum TaxID=2364126 RepID=A0ABN9XNG4_9DINO|nr:unnamed protein product [Polarella glacialis]
MLQHVSCLWSTLGQVKSAIMELDSEDVNDAFVKAVRAARNCGYVAGGWVTLPADPPERRIDGGHEPLDEEAFMARYGYANYYAHWSAAPLVEETVTGFRLALQSLGITGPAYPQVKCDSLSKARSILVAAVANGMAYGEKFLSDEEAGQWVDQFLAPACQAGADVELWTGNADGVATINTGIVFVLGTDEGERSVGMLWLGDED